MVLIAIALFAIGLYLGCCGVLVMRGDIPLASGAVLLGGLETMGPAAFVIGACAALFTGYGLLKLQPWARRVTIVFAAALLVMSIPSASSAVADFRLAAVVRDGLKIIAAVIIMRYLYLEPERQV